MCNHNCNQGRLCPARRRTGSIAALIAAVLGLTACSETTTKWDYGDEIYIGAGGPDHGGYSGAVAGFDDPSGVVGVDSPSDGDDAASDDAGAGDDDSGADGDVSEGHGHGDHDDGDHDDGDGEDGDHDGGDDD